MQLIEAATDQRDLRALKGARFEALQGNRQGEYSIRLNDQWRLVLRFEESDSVTIVVIRGVEDYH
jgi:proteic killer suppression protein